MPISLKNLGLFLENDCCRCITYAGPFLANVIFKKGGGAKFQCADYEGGGMFLARHIRGGGQDFSARKSKNSTTPLVAVNNDRSLNSVHKSYVILAVTCM